MDRLSARERESTSRNGELRIGLAFLVIVPLLLAALAFWFGSEYRRLGSSEDEVARAHARQLLLSELFSSMKDAETGQRGFVITGNDQFLDPYRQGRTAVTEQLRMLQSFPTVPAEHQRLGRIEHLIEAKFTEMERGIAMRRTQGLAAAANLVALGRGKALMDSLRVEALEGRTAEAEQVARTLARQRERTRMTEWISWGVVIAVALTFLLLGLGVRRSERQRAALARVADEAAARRRAIFDSTLDAIVLINPSGTIETINSAASHLFGYSPKELVRRDISLIVDLAPGEGPFLERLGLGPNGLAHPFRHNLSARCANGTTIPVEAALSTMPLPDGMHIVAALRDIAEREKVERIKDQFLSTVSHELRTPLTSIVGSLGLLRGGSDGELPAGMQRLLVIAENNANRLIRLVNDLLDIEKLEAGEMSFEFTPIDLRDVAVRALDTVRGMAQNQNVALETDLPSEPVTVRADAERLIQVFANLLGNAVRFSPVGGIVTLSVRRKGGLAEASVTDQGPGVDAEMIGRLFTRFAQSIQGPVGQTRGTGLGLAISREIVRSHGGGIWYDPAPGGGGMFSFNLPLWNAGRRQADSDPTPRLLICASESEGDGIAAALESRDVGADVVQDSAALLQALERRHYMALLLDGRCLGADSRLLHDIRSRPGQRTLPIIAIAGGDEDPEELASLDVVDWIPRPLDPARLNTAVASIVERSAHRIPLVLHVDDDTDTLEVTAAALEGRVRVVHATDIASARALIARDQPDVVIVDLALPDGSGEELVADLALSGSLSTPVIIYSAQEPDGAFAHEVSAVLTKSKRSLSALIETIDTILDREPHERQDA